MLDPLYGLLIIGLAFDKESFIAKILSNNRIVYLGSISYCIYVLHAPLEKPLMGFLGFWPYFMTVLLISGLCFHFIETPCRDWLLKKLEKFRLL